jgi:hypothetical protein
VLLLYIDESGTFDQDIEHSIVGGLAVHAADIQHFRAGVDAIIADYLDAQNRDIELHATAMRSGSGRWRKIPQGVRHGLLQALVHYVGDYESPTGNAFSLLAVVRAPHAVPTADPLERMFEELLLRFRSLLERSSTSDAPGVGLVVADEAKHERVVQPLVAKWRETGIARRPWVGPLDRIVEVPLFVDSGATRLLQAADIIAHAVYQYYERGDPSWLGPLLPAFDTNGAVLHGLVHLSKGYRTCPCPACVSRMARDRVRAATWTQVREGRQGLLPLAAAIGIVDGPPEALSEQVDEIVYGNWRQSGGDT